MIRQQQRSTPFPYTTLFRSGGETGREQGELDQVVLCAAAADALVLTGKRCQRIYRRGEIAPLERGKAARQGRQVGAGRSEEHTSELQSRRDLVCRLLLEKKN